MPLNGCGRCAGRWGIVAGALEEVGAVDGGGVDVDQGFVGGEGGVGDFLPEQGAVGVFLDCYGFHGE